jgi:hypothetical protein
MRREFERRTRERLVAKLRAERERHRRATALLITDPNNADAGDGAPPPPSYFVDTPRPSPRTNRTRRVPLAGVPPELKAYGAAARASYVAGPAPDGRGGGNPRGSATYNEELAAASAEKGRQKVQRPSFVLSGHAASLTPY